MRRYFFPAGIILLLWAMIFPSPASARSIVADLAIRSIAIDHNFTGIDILLFGARDSVGEIVVVVRGPEQSYIVRKKERVAGVWVNRHSMKFDRVNGFYAIAASRPLEQVKNEWLLAKLGVGPTYMPIAAAEEGNTEEFRSALIRYKQARDLYPVEIEPVTFWGDTLFRTVLKFPKNIMKGKYTAEVYLFNDGQLLGVQTTPIGVNKIGFEAFVSDVARNYPLLYGIVSVLIALLAGWTASTIFQRM